MDLTLEGVEAAIRALVEAEDPITIKPTKLLVQPFLLEQVRRVLYYKKPIRRCSGMRKRKLSLYWRK